MNGYPSYINVWSLRCVGTKLRSYTTFHVRQKIWSLKYWLCFTFWRQSIGPIKLHLLEFLSNERLRVTDRKLSTGRLS